jgi:acetolactate synthase-1/2/3 large subunit
MKLADYVANFLEENGVGACFMVSGGAVLHLLDSINNKTDIPIICSQHEQAAATGADAFSRTSKEKIGLVVATSGPGATNLTTGVSNAFFDSIPMICITGQVATFRSKAKNKIRQYGFQETDVVNIFRPITKLAMKLESPNQIRYLLEKAIYFAKNDRPGPVLIDIPDDLQRAEIDPIKLKGYRGKSHQPLEGKKKLRIFNEINKYLAKSSKPIVILGGGIRISKSEDQIINFLEKLNIPFITTWAAKDLLPASHYLNIGTFGVCGPRAGNWAVSESDLVIILGARLNQMQVGGKLSEFAPSAKKIMVDIEKSEIRKFRKTDLKIDFEIVFDLKEFTNKCHLESHRNSHWKNWLISLRDQFSVINEHKNDQVEISAYKFIDKLSGHSNKGSIVITDAGGNLCWTMQAFNCNSNQRLISSWNHSPMGFSLPAAIGASIANPDLRITCIIGDGGLMMCLEELGTITRNNLPIDIFIFNNKGHGIQKQTINTWLGGRMVGVDHESGLYFPDFQKIASGFEIEYLVVNKLADFNLDTSENIYGPRIFDVMIKPEQTIFPMLKFGGNLKNLDETVQMPILSIG